MSVPESGLRKRWKNDLYLPFAHDNLRYWRSGGEVVNKAMIATVVDASDVQVCTSCMICDKSIPIHFHDSVPRICSECKDRIKKILYPPEIRIPLDIDINQLLQHVSYNDAQLGREK